MADVSIHPAVDGGLKPAGKDFAGARSVASAATAC
jgi:hypothetical protein